MLQALASLISMLIHSIVVSALALILTFFVCLHGSLLVSWLYKHCKIDIIADLDQALAASGKPSLKAVS